MLAPRLSLAATYLIVLGIMLTTAPLGFRRRYPVGAFAVIMAAVLATNGHTSTVTFAAVLFAAYSAIVYSRYRRLALLCVFTAAVIVTAAFPDTTPPVPARFTALLVLLPTAAVAVAMRTWRRRAGDSAERLRLAQAGHEAQTRRAVEAERARIAGELHDVVTHNVSVMVVQAGAARRVLSSSPEQAREALLAVEGSGRTAMAELRHLLGLLAPSITRRLVERFAPRANHQGLSALTPRELEVLGLVARGLSNAELAGALTLSEATVKTHVARILGKLGLRDRVQAVVLAYETGLVTPGSVC